MTPAPLESVAERRVVAWADKHGILHTKLNLQGRRHWPDRCFWLPGGRPLLIEFKRVGAGPTEAQKHLHNQLAIRDYEVFVTDDAEKAIARLMIRIYKAAMGFDFELKS